MLPQLRRLAQALLLTAKDNAFELLNALLVPVLRSQLHQAIAPTSKTPWLSDRLWANKTEDGAVTAGIRPAQAYAKFAIPKGLPLSRRSVLAVENDPHTLDNFSGVIEEGYGKGIKSLLFRDNVIVKLGGRTFSGLAEYHLHEAERAGTHYDLCVEGLPPGTSKFEINIPRGDFRGRYAFNQTPCGVLVTRMVDRGVLHPKPAYRLKPESFLETLREAHAAGELSIDQKFDGSLGNAFIYENRVHIRSHRETGVTYYDQLPALEFLRNNSRMALCRTLFPGPNLDRTLIKGELVHPDGVSRVSGILNALPDRARQIQHLRGPVKFYAWDLVKYRGKDVTRLPYVERRELLEQAVSDIRRFNKNWDVVPKCPPGVDPYEFYQEIVQKPLPYGEGIVIKASQKAFGEDTWIKVKKRDFVDLQVVEIQEGRGKYAGTVGRFVVRNPANGAIGEIGSFAITDEQRQWIWDHRDKLAPSPLSGGSGGGQLLRGVSSQDGSYPVAKCLVMNVTARGAPRAGVFVMWHEGKGSTEAGLAMYSESLAGGNPAEADRIKYALKSAAGWKKS